MRHCVALRAARPRPVGGGGGVWLFPQRAGAVHPAYVLHVVLGFGEGPANTKQGLGDSIGGHQRRRMASLSLGKRRKKMGRMMRSKTIT